MTRSGVECPVEEPAVIDPLEPLCGADGPFRPNVAALAIRRTAAGLEVLLGKRHDFTDAWQWPQGGVDPGETVEQALHREVREEIGVDGVEIRYRYPFRLRYRFPAALSGKFHPNQGQVQHYFLIAIPAGSEPRATGVETEEFSELRWFPLADAIHSAIWFKRPVYERAVAHALEVAPVYF
jgi:putative (di)nucleoside polyphosphate hydrolase